MLQPDTSTVNEPSARQLFLPVPYSSLGYLTVSMREHVGVCGLEELRQEFKNHTQHCKWEGPPEITLMIIVPLTHLCLVLALRAFYSCCCPQKLSNMPTSFLGFERKSVTYFPVLANSLPFNTLRNKAGFFFHRHTLLIHIQLMSQYNFVLCTTAA